eukprot:scaffold8570_cov111-Isochrysis_galbana.AAC.2
MTNIAAAVCTTRVVRVARLQTSMYGSASSTPIATGGAKSRPARGSRPSVLERSSRRAKPARNWREARTDWSYWYGKPTCEPHEGGGLEAGPWPDVENRVR